MSNGIVYASDIKEEMMLAFDFGNHPVKPGQPSPYHKYYCGKCHAMIAHAIGEGDFTPVIRNMSEALVDHLADFLTTEGEHERCALLKAQREEVVRTTSAAQLEASRAEYAEVIEAHYYGFDINCKWSNEREDWLEAKQNLPKAAL